MEPFTYSWPSCRPSVQVQLQLCTAELVLPLQQRSNFLTDSLVQAEDSSDVDNDEQLTHHQLQAWVGSLIYADGQLAVTSDSMQLLPATMPYELLGPCILAAVDRCAAATSTPPKHRTAQHTPAQQPDGAPAQLGEQQFGLQLYGVDLQEPVAGPLTTCFQAYPALQRLLLQELNVDTQAAAALAQHTCCSPHQDSLSSRLQQLHLRAVFMGQLAWQALAKGLGHSSCQLQTLRLQDCLSTCSLHLLAGAVAAGCSNLQELDLSCNSLSPSTHSSSGNTCSWADEAWASLIDALAQPCCKQLQALVLSQCNLGPAAAAALSRLLKAKGRSNLQQLQVAQCAGMGEAAVQQLAAVAGSHPSLRVLDLSCTGFTDQCLKALTQGLGSSWRWHQHTCQHLQELRLAGNSSLSGTAVVQLAKSLAAGSSLGVLHTLDLSNCPGLGDAGAAALAACLPSSHHHSLRVLNLCGCEVTDEGAAALAAAISGDSMAHASSTAHSSGSASAGRRPAQHMPCLQELRLADNQITAAGIQSFVAAVQQPGCSLHLLDISFNWVGPEAVRPLSEAAAALPQPLTVLRECSHDLWRVEAAKAAARAAAAADAATAAAAEAVAAAAAAGSSWDPHQGCDQLSVQQHPAAATALGFANSSYHGGSAVTGWGGSSTRTFAGSPVRGADSPALSCGGGSAVEAGSAAVWLFNGLYRRSDCGPGEAWSPDSPPGPADHATKTEPVPAAADAGGVVSTRLVFPKAIRADLAERDGQHNSKGSGRDGWVPAGSSGSSRRSSLSGAEESNGSLRTVDPRLLVGNGSSSGSIHALVGSGCADVTRCRSSSLQDDLSCVADVEDACQAAAVAGNTAAADANPPAGLLLAAAAADTTVAAAEAADACPANHTPAAVAAASKDDAAADCDGLISSPGSCSSDTTSSGCMQQEASFRYQIERSAEDVVSSPTRYDQQQQHHQQEQRRQQQQQLKGLLGSQEFNLSPPNPLFFSSSPLASPIGPRKPQVAALDGPPIPFSLQPRPAAAAAAASGADVATPTGRAAGGRNSKCAAGAAAVAGVPEPQQKAEPSAACVRPAGPPASAAASNGGAADPATAAPVICAQQPAAGVQRNQRPGGSGVRAVMQLRQPFSPDRQLAAPSIRALPPGSPRRRCGLNSPTPAAAAAAYGSGVSPAAAGSAAFVVASRHPGGLLQATGAQAACKADACSPAKSACSEGSCSSVGSSQSPARFSSSPSKLARRRVSQERPHMQQQQQLQLAGGLAAGSNTPASLGFQQTAAVPVLEGQGAQHGAVPTGEPSIRQTLQRQLEQQRQQRHCARQLFEAGLAMQGREVKAVASSGSYWCNLLAVADGWEMGADGIECSTHVAAVPLVGG